MNETQAPQTMPSQEPVSQVVQQGYVPSALERKKAMLMYIFFGIFIGIMKKEVTIFELYHIKQATGRRLTALTFGVVSLVVIFLPVFKLIPIAIAIVLVVLWGVCVKQAWDGKYIESGQKSFLSVFPGLGGWLFEIFEIQLILTTQPEDMQIDSENPQPMTQQPTIEQHQIETKTPDTMV